MAEIQNGGQNMYRQRYAIWGFDNIQQKRNSVARKPHCWASKPIFHAMRYFSSCISIAGIMFSNPRWRKSKMAAKIGVFLMYANNRNLSLQISNNLSLETSDAVIVQVSMKTFDKRIIANSNMAEIQNGGQNIYINNNILIAITTQCARNAIFLH